jgi:T5SS/PEP-CTERM-associated repeat protein
MISRHFLIAFTLLVGSAGVSPAADRSWNNPAGGTFSTSMNWLGGVPGSSDRAIFNLAGQSYTVTFTSNATTSQLVVNNSEPTLDLDGRAYSVTGQGTFIGQVSGANGSLKLVDGTFTGTTARIGDGFGTQGSLTVSGAGAIWTNSGEFDVGNLGTGRLTIEGGGRVNSNSVSYIGADINSHNSTARVTGTGSTWSNSGELVVGRAGEGILTIDSGASVTSANGYVGRNSSAEGAVNVSGPESTWTNSGTLEIGSSGTGTLLIENGGKVTNANGYIGRYSGSYGAATVTGSDSLWTNSNLFLSNSSTLTIALDGRVEVSADTLISATSPQSAIIFNQGTLSTTSLTFLPSQLQGTGTVTTHGLLSDIDLRFDQSHSAQQQLNFGSQPNGVVVNLDVNGTGMLGVGHIGQGSMTVSDGVAVSSSAGVLGSSAGASGAATVAGTNSSWTNSGDLAVGLAGTGTLAISSGGTVVNKGCKIGHTSTGSGAVAVIGAGSTWTNNGALSIGFSGTGTLTIDAGGTVRNTGNTDSTTTRIGANSGSQGSVTVSGAGSKWTISSELEIGDSGTAEGWLTIENGGTVTSGRCLVGLGSQARGAIRVSGAGSTWNASSLTAGLSGTGTLTIDSGGKVSSSSSTIGYSASSHGAVTVTDNGSILSSSNVKVGEYGTGTLTIESGGSVDSFTGDIAARSDSQGTVLVDGSNSAWIIQNNLYVGGSILGAGGQGTLGISNGAKVSTSGLSGMTIWSTGTLTGAGGTVEGTVNNRGLVAPGNSQGALTISGNYTQLATGKLAIEIADATNFDRLLISGQASLGGILELTLLDDFVPASGLQFDILDWNASSGAFSSIVLPPLPGGKAWDTNQLYVSGILSVIGPPPIAGDFDSDNDVDGADFAVWNANFPKSASATLAKGDADGDGDVDGADFVVWQTQLSSSAGAAASPVPEPASLPAMLFLASIVSFCRVRKVLACSA